MFTELISRKDAMEQGLKRYYTGKSCAKAGHLSERHSQKGNCIACMADKFQENKQDAEFRKKRKEQDVKDRKSVSRKDWEKANKEHLYFYRLIYFEANKDQLKTVQKTYRENNKEVIKERKREWATKNWWRFAVHTAKRRAGKLQRTPCWLTKEDRTKMREMYKLASDKTKETGIKWQVDHIVPLQGKLVSGLHVPENLQVIPAIENRSKWNKFELTV